MGQKVNPLGIRLGITRDWTSKWYASKKQFPMLVHTDFLVREFLKKRLSDASVSRVLIERAAKKVNITIQTARPGIVIGKKGEDIENLRGENAEMMGSSGARARCAARGREHLAADREARDVSSRHEARRHEHDAQRRARHQGADVRSPQWLGDCAHGVVSRGPRSAAYLPRRHRLRPG